MIRILFLIRSLDSYGAERQLVELVKGLDKHRFAVSVVTFYDQGTLRDEVKNLEGVNLDTLGKKGRWDFAAFLGLWRLARREVPDVVHGYTDAPNLLCWVLGKLRRAKVIWGVASSDLDRVIPPGILESMIFFLSARLSRSTDLIISNSDAGRRYHVAHGYDPSRVAVIPNGIDTERFRPDSALRVLTRRKWGIGEDTWLIGIVARLDPVKDHGAFLRAAATLAADRSDVYFVCIGGGPASYREELEALAVQLRLTDRVLWVGEYRDMPAAYNALDILTSSSLSEGLSNAIAEGMACGVPCVGTNVGDTARVIGRSEQIVPPAQPLALQKAWRRFMELPIPERRHIAHEARARIQEFYDQRLLIARTELAIESLFPSHETRDD